MGICLDTDKNGMAVAVVNDVPPTTFPPKQANGLYANGRQTTNESTKSEPIASSREDLLIIPAPASGPGPGPPRRLPLTVRAQSILPNPQQIPDIPIIFVLGGPGSGKLTHCHHLTEIDPKLVHINMMSPFLEIASQQGSVDPNLVPAYKALEITVGKLMEAKDANGVVITGYPRNMRDVVEYMAKVQRVDGVILLDWSDRSLERQIRVGAQTGQIDAELAKAELNNYRANVIPVAQFFDQQGYLHLVAGQRDPPEIFDDLAEEIGGILAYPSGSFRHSPERRDSGGSQHTQAEVHSPVESQRRVSVDSVDLMIQEEMQNQFPTQTINAKDTAVYDSPVHELAPASSPTNKWRAVQNKVHPSGGRPASQNLDDIPMHQDVRSILQMVQADTILQRAAQKSSSEN